jgi:hypothetical protein
MTFLRADANCLAYLELACGRPNTRGQASRGEEVKETKCIFEELIAEIMSIS